MDSSACASQLERGTKEQGRQHTNEKAQKPNNSLSPPSAFTITTSTITTAPSPLQPQRPSNLPRIPAALQTPRSHHILPPRQLHRHLPHLHLLRHPGPRPRPARRARMALRTGPCTRRRRPTQPPRTPHPRQRDARRPQRRSRRRQALFLRVQLHRAPPQRQRPVRRIEQEDVLEIRWAPAERAGGGGRRRARVCGCQARTQA